jgi:hypothetical protein
LENFNSKCATPIEIVSIKMIASNLELPTKNRCKF